MLVWEASVRATYHFLKEEDILLFKKLIPEKYLDAVCLYAVRDNMSKILGFLGVSDDGIEMLFIHPNARGKGIGKRFLDYAVNELHLRKVNVNEQLWQPCHKFHIFDFDSMVFLGIYYSSLISMM